jgi:hypothetical protein
MIKHIVVWKLKESADGRTAAENAVEMKVHLEALNGLVPGMGMLEVGLDIGGTPASADVALYSEFADVDALHAYQIHPDHVAEALFCGRLCAERILVDYEV